jgi:hypothetical protein
MLGAAEWTSERQAEKRRQCRTLPAPELCARCDRPVRLERLEAQVAAGRHDRRSFVDESRTLEDRQRLYGDVERESVERLVERSVSVLRVALDGRSRHVEASEIGGEPSPLQSSLRGVLRPIALTVELWNRPDWLGRSVGRAAAADQRNAERKGKQTPEPH